MICTIPTGQFVGSTIEHLLFLLGGVCLLPLWPKQVKRQVASGKISQEAADAKLKKVRPWIGWFLIAWSVYGFVYDCSLYFS
jgi:hypothetical protein